MAVAQAVASTTVELPSERDRPCIACSSSASADTCGLAAAPTACLSESKAVAAQRRGKGGRVKDSVSGGPSAQHGPRVVLR